ncbi:MAG: DUF6279 family lipoprotein [Burkholderiaceae bacterium]
MSTSYGETCPGVGPGDSQPGIIARLSARFVLLLLALALAGCSATRLAYNQAPTLAYWWIDGHVDLNNGQSDALRKDIDAFFAWHRRDALPAYTRLLRTWQSMILADTDADQVCTQYTTLRVHIDTATAQVVAPLARLALSLGPAQLDHQRRHQAKGNRGFEKDFIEGDAAQRLDRRLTTATDRAERLYGTLTPAQITLLREGLQRSPWDPARTLAERQRRQADLLQTVRDLQLAPVQAEASVAAHIRRLGHSPTPGHADYSQALVRHGCGLLAALHNSTDAVQRAHALRTLRDYEDDLAALTGQP